MTGQRLKAVRKKLGLNQQNFGAALKINASAISQMENNRIKPSLDTLLLLSKNFKVDLHWLITGRGDMFMDTEEKRTNDANRSLSKLKAFINDELLNIVKVKESNLNAEAFDLPVMGEIAAGEAVETGDSVLDIVSIRRSMLKGNITEYVCLRVNGRSMEPDILNNDVVIIRKSNDWERLNGRICAVRIDGSITLKKLSMDVKRKLILLLPINEDFSPIVIDPKDHEDLGMIGYLHYLYRKL
ncbi:MAG TPA: helix-turn-helix domain-containing protein [Candidatus Cloacimonetes bacterium]|jgi:SOS-response transcriptional repressor LexA|nr:repressor LexA [Candidatus Cloacimonas sp.]HHZ14698.1 helix-turn-helix domain-containing protein [Candidatus Cloacimonadota bacterium]